MSTPGRARGSLDCTLRGILRLMLPLIMTSLSTELMYVLDRVVLSHYSEGAMNAVGIAGNIAYVYVVLCISVTSIAEVFVGQYNGACAYTKAASPVHQMVFLSLASFIIFLPLAFAGHELLLPEIVRSEGKTFLRIVIAFTPLSALLASFASFFVGIGRPGVVTWTVVSANILNFLLDILLVFGFWKIPALGAPGAAIASVTAQFLQVVVLFAAFSLPKARRKYHTNRWSLNLSLLWKCCKVGAPFGICHALEIVAWAVVYILQSTGGLKLLSLYTISFNVLTLSFAVLEGQIKAVSTIVANLIGAGEWEMIHRTVAKFFKIHLGFIAFWGIPLLIFPESLFYLFGGVSAQSLAGEISTIFFLAWIYIFLNGFAWIYTGILMAGGDTRFPAITSALLCWGMVVLPIALIAQAGKLKGAYTWGFAILFISVLLALMAWRYKKGLWRKRLV